MKILLVPAPITHPVIQPAYQTVLESKAKMHRAYQTHERAAKVRRKDPKILVGRKKSPALELQGAFLFTFAFISKNI